MAKQQDYINATVRLLWSDWELLRLKAQRFGLSRTKLLTQLAREEDLTWMVSPKKSPGADEAFAQLSEINSGFITQLEASEQRLKNELEAQTLLKQDLIDNFRKIERAFRRAMFSQ